MNATRKVKLKDITCNLSCGLCKGYIIDATTTIECLHSFCKSCIVQHLEKSEYCPVCDVQLHSTKPLSGIRSDQMLQEIIYKLVPKLFGNEMIRRREFYKEHTEFKPTSQMDSGQVYNQLYITSDDQMNVSLEYSTDDLKLREESKRYIRCSAEVSVFIIKKLVEGKYELKKDTHIDIMYGERILPDDFLLMDIAYKYSWTDSGTKPLQLTYRVRGNFPEALIPIKSIFDGISSTIPSGKRRSRAVTDSEILKSSNRNVPIVPETPPSIKSSANAHKGRKNKRSLILNEKNSPLQPKKKKSRKSSTPMKNFKEMESQSDHSSPIKIKMPCKTTTVGVGLESSCSGPAKEVQLRISENGIISATSMGSGEERIIGNVDKDNNGQEKKKDDGTISQNNDHPKIINNPAGDKSSSMHTLLVTNNTKPAYVTLNIPTVTFGINPPIINVLSNSVNQLATTQSMAMSLTTIPCQNGGSSSPPKKKQGVKKSTPSKAKSKLNSNTPIVGKNGAQKSINFQDKKANVQKALLDLQKKHYSDPTPMDDSSPKSKTLLGISTTQQHPIVNGISTSMNPMPFPLSALANSGMTVNFIPYADIKPNTGLMMKGKNGISNSNIQPTTTTTTKRMHQTTVVNGDLKFTTTPRHILPSPSKGLEVTNGYNSNSETTTPPKKPPKFFKSRHPSPVPVLSSSDGESPMKNKDKDSNKKKAKNKSQSQCPAPMVNGNGHGHMSPIQIPTLTFNQSNSNKLTTSTLTTPTCNTTPSGTLPKSSPGVSSNLMNNSLLTLLQMNSPFNGFAPLVTSDYISMPYVNTSRLPFHYSLPFPLSQPQQAFTNSSFSNVNLSNGMTTTTTSTSSAQSKSYTKDEDISSTTTSTPCTDQVKDSLRNYLGLKINGNLSPEESDSQIEPLSLKVVANAKTTNGKSSSSEGCSNGKDTHPLTNGNGLKFIPKLETNKSSMIESKLSDREEDSASPLNLQIVKGNCTKPVLVDETESLSNGHSGNLETTSPKKSPVDADIEPTKIYKKEICKNNVGANSGDGVSAQDIFKDTNVCNNNNNPPMTPDLNPPPPELSTASL